MPTGQSPWGTNLWGDGQTCSQILFDVQTRTGAANCGELTKGNSWRDPKGLVKLFGRTYYFPHIELWTAYYETLTKDLSQTNQLLADSPGCSAGPWPHRESLDRLSLRVTKWNALIASLCSTTSEIWKKWNWNLKRPPKKRKIESPWTNRQGLDNLDLVGAQRELEPQQKSPNFKWSLGTCHLSRRRRNLLAQIEVQFLHA